MTSFAASIPPCVAVVSWIVATGCSVPVGDTVRDAQTVYPTAVVPADGDTDVPLDAAVRLRFSGWLDANTVDGSVIEVRSGRVVKWNSVYFDPVDRELVAVPANPFWPRTVYEVIVHAGLRTLEGDEVPEHVAATFLTGDAVGGQGGFAPPSYARDVAPVFAAHCTSCHGGAAPVAGLSLETPQDVAATAVGVEASVPGWMRVVPYRPGRSYLLLKVLNAPYNSGARMPRSPDGGATPRLDDAQIAALRDWILEGAFF